jgi:hypothetical protein
MKEGEFEGKGDWIQYVIIKHSRWTKCGGCQFVRSGKARLSTVAEVNEDLGQDIQDPLVTVCSGQNTLAVILTLVMICL